MAKVETGTQDLVANVAPSQTMFCKTHAKFSSDAALSSLPQIGMAPPKGVKSLGKLCISLILASEQLVLLKTVQGAGPI